MKKITVITSSIAMVIALLTGCASGFRTNIKIEGVTFYSQVPAAVSSIWDDGVDTFYVLKRNQTISSLYDGNGIALPIIVSGSYFKVNGVHSRLVMTVGNENQSAFK